MTKSQAIKIFKTQGRLARALRISKQGVSQWPEELDQKRADWVMATARREGLLPEGAEESAAA